MIRISFPGRIYRKANLSVLISKPLPVWIVILTLIQAGRPDPPPHKWFIALNSSEVIETKSVWRQGVRVSRSLEPQNDAISKWVLILKGVNSLSISDFWSAWINKTVDSISIIVASWQKTKRPWWCRPRVIFTICSLFTKYPPANCLESTSKNPQSPAKLPQKLSWTGKKLWIFEVFDRRQNGRFLVIFNKSRDSNFEGGAYCWGLCAFTKHTQRDTFRDINEYKMAMVSLYLKIFGSIFRDHKK